MDCVIDGFDIGQAEEDVQKDDLRSVIMDNCQNLEIETFKMENCTVSEIYE
jgi:hypothetical protein